MSMKILSAIDVQQAASRLAATGKLYRTPVMSSPRLNQYVGHTIVLKCENLQKTGAFKARGALNTVAKAVQTEKPSKVVCYSSGNHAQAVAWACAQFQLPCTVVMPRNVSPLKAQATRTYGAEVVLTESRQEAEALSQDLMKQGARLIAPFDDDDVICGQGTATLEALEDVHKAGESVDAVFAPVGGGGLLSGTYLASTANIGGRIPLVFGGEPLAGNDATQSLATGKIVKLTQQPKTLADGAMTLAISDRTFHYLQQVKKVYEIAEDEMRYWTQWLTHLAKLTIEPTGALSVAAAIRWLREQEPVTPDSPDSKRKTVVCVISGGNIAFEKRQEIYSKDMLHQVPSLDVKL